MGKKTVGPSPPHRHFQSVWPPARRTDEQNNFTSEILVELALLTGGCN